MKLINKLAVETVSGALNPVTGSTEEVSIGKGQKSKVVMQGYIGGPQEKGEDGHYRSTVYGRLPVKAAVAISQDKDGSDVKRYVLDIAGGLRGVLFHTNGKDGDYHGNIDFGDQIMPLFGRKTKGQNGTFISLWSKELEAKKDAGHSVGQPAAAPAGAAPGDDFGDDIPF